MKRLLLFFLLILAIECHTQNITGQVVKIADGDTFTLLTDEKVQIRVRLYGIDAPEWSQPFSKVSRQFLSDLVFSKRVSVKVMDTDKYGRTVGLVFVEGMNMNEALLRGGMAWHYKQYDHNPAWAKLEDEARHGKRGLWVDDAAVAPWVFRHGKR